MPQPTVEEFWNLLAKSRLVDAGTVATLRRESAAGAAGGETVPSLARRLIERGLLTRWQAKRLAAGNVGPFFLGEYRLLERHEREGDALLFTARHEPSGRIVSVVVLNAKRCREIEVWTEIVQRTTAASRATDPMPSRTFSLEQHESGRLIVCEQVEGTSLTEELERHGPLPAVQAGVLVSQIARAVAAIHAAGGVHGSLSLDVLRREPAPGGVPRTGRVRLLQFPLAGDPHRVPLRPWSDAAELAALGRNAAFVAPELILPGRACDPPSDVYSIGAILYALVSGSHPCWVGDAAATLERAALRGPDPLAPPAVSGELATLIGFLMARDPAERYQTPAEAADAIAACLGLATAARVSPPKRPASGPPREPVAAQAGAPRGGVAPIPAPRSSAAGPPRAGHRRAARLQLLGAAVALALLAGTAALVASRLARSPQPAVDVATTPPPAAATSSGKQPSATGVTGWGEAPPAGRPDAAFAASGVAGSGDGPARADRPATVAARQVVVDDAALPWASPTEGPRPRLAYLPPGSQLILLARPADLTGDPEGARVLESLGPEVAAGLGTLAAWCGCGVDGIESLQAGWQADAAGALVGGYAMRLVAGRAVPTGDAARRESWGPTKPRVVEGETVHVGEEFSFWVPSTEDDRVLVVTANGAAGDAAPPGCEPLVAELARRAVAGREAGPDALQVDLPRELENLVAMLDAERHLTLFGSPHYLLNQGRVALAGPLAKLAEPLEDLFGEAVKAAAVSAHFGEHCYLELDAIATLDVPARNLARDLAAHLDGMADSVERYCLALDPHPYGRVLVSRLPQMLRVMVASMRSGAEGQGAILNAYLPRPAGHNLALAAELALAQSPGAAAVARPAAAAPQAADALGGLEKKITLVFARDTLERAIEMVSEEIGVSIEIVGPDLELEGITKNQSFGLEARDVPARAVLLEILAKANPDGKLIYVVRGKGDEETILVTTRAAAEKRGEEAGDAARSDTP